MQLISLFKKKIELHSRKYHLIGKIDRIGLNPLYLKELKILLKHEQRINKELKKEVKKLSKSFNLKLVNHQLANIELTTKKQFDILNMIRFRIFKQTNYQKFKDECKKEVEQSKFFSKILKEIVIETEGLGAPREEFEKGKLLVKQAQKTYRELIAAGNIKRVHQKAKELILINRRIKKTKLYEFIKYDIDFVTNKAKHALKNKKESRLQFLLAGAYIVSPGTFELTGMYLFFRYIAKYAKSKKSRIYSQGAGASSSNNRTIPN